MGHVEAAAEAPEPLATAALLRAALKQRDDKPATSGTSAPPAPQSVMVDGGTENFNAAMEALVAENMMARILAQTDVVESNSMIERFWLSAKHNWLFLHRLGSLETAQNLLGAYVREHNANIPHSAHGVRTPDEVYYARATDLPDKIAASQVEAREARVRTNRERAAACGRCHPPPGGTAQRHDDLVQITGTT